MTLHYLSIATMVLGAGSVLTGIYIECTRPYWNDWGGSLFIGGAAAMGWGVFGLALCSP